MVLVGLPPVFFRRDRQASTCCFGLSLAISRRASVKRLEKRALPVASEIIVVYCKKSATTYKPIENATIQYNILLLQSQTDRCDTVIGYTDSTTTPSAKIISTGFARFSVRLFVDFTLSISAFIVCVSGTSQKLAVA